MSLSVRLPRLSPSPRRVTAVAMAGSLAAAGVLATACTPPATRTISGTVRGVDGRIVDVMLGFDVLDAAGNKIDLGAINNGYSAIQRLNHCVPTYGATSSQACTYQGQVTQVTGYNWSLQVPANAVKVYIEVYPKAPTPTAWVNNYRGYTGPAAGDTNTSTYGFTYRQGMMIGNGLSNIPIVLPKVCSAGGTTGFLVGHINGWPYGQTGSVNAWSLDAANSPTQGWGMGFVDGNGNYRINDLQRNQRYGLIASGPGFYRNVVDYQRATSNDTLIPAACFTKTFNF